MTTLIDQRLETVHIATGPQYQDILRAAEDAGGSTVAVVDALVHQARLTPALLRTTVMLSQLREQPHQLHAVMQGGVGYWLQIDHDHQLYALHREPTAGGDAPA